MEQKTILITGASRGIGKSIALRFASRGYHTFLNCSSSVDELKKLRAYIRKKYHTPCTIVVGDVGNPDHVRAIYNRIYQDCSHLDVLVNNAGISHINLLSDMTDEDWNRIIQTNLSSVFYCCRQAIPPMVSSVRKDHQYFFHVGNLGCFLRSRILCFQIRYQRIYKSTGQGTGSK